MNFSVISVITSMKDNVFVWSNFSLDGAACVLLMRWACNKPSIPYETCTASNFRKKFTKWMTNHNITDFDKVYIFDVDVVNHIDLIDQPNVVIIDHHSERADYAFFEKADILCAKDSSSVKLFQRILNICSEFAADKYQQRLIDIVDDYDSYSLIYPESQVLNALFWTYKGKFEWFIKAFSNGFGGFTAHHISTYRSYRTLLDRLLGDLKIFIGDNVEIGDGTYKVASTFAETNIDEVAHFITEETGADVGIVVNMGTKRVSFRAAKDREKLSVATLAKTLCRGGGTRTSAGGVLTDEFKEFSKRLKPINV